MKEKGLAVFFRNNHFSVISKNSGRLYLLVTDQGYLHQSQVVWERLDEVDGDTVLVDSDFVPFRPAPLEIPIEFAAEAAEASAAALLAPADDGEDPSLALARQMQEEYAQQIATAMSPDSDDFPPPPSREDLRLARQLEEQAAIDGDDDDDDIEDDEAPLQVPAGKSKKSKKKPSHHHALPASADELARGHNPSGKGDKGDKNKKKALSQSAKENPTKSKEKSDDGCLVS